MILFGIWIERGYGVTSLGDFGLNTGTALLRLMSSDNSHQDTKTQKENKVKRIVLN